MKMSALQIKAVVGAQQAIGIIGTFPPKRDFLARGVNGNTLHSLTESKLLGVRLYRGKSVVFIEPKGMQFLAGWESVVMEAIGARRLTSDSLVNDDVLETLGKEVIKRLKWS